MKSSVFKDFVMPPLVLTLICIVITGALAYTFGITFPIIQNQKIEAANRARALVLPSAQSFEQVDATDMPDGFVDIYRAENGSGYVVTTEARGYGGALKVMVGIGSDTKISSIEILEHSETAGLGSKVTLPAYKNQYSGLDSNLEGVEFIGGATISSKAVYKAVGTAYESFGKVAGVEVAVKERDPMTDAQKEKLFPGETLERLEIPGEAYAVGDDVVIVTAGEGFMDEIVIAVRFGSEPAVKYVKVVSCKESDDYGLKYTRSGYLEKIEGATSGDSLEIIAGSTITGQAFRQAVQQAIDAHGDAVAAAEVR